MLNPEIQRIGAAIGQSFQPRQVILFGSYARNEQTNESDYDIAVILKDNDPRQYDLLYGQIKGLIRSITSNPVDLILAYQKKYLEMAELVPTVHYAIKTEGIILYDTI